MHFMICRRKSAIIGVGNGFVCSMDYDLINWAEPSLQVALMSGFNFTVLLTDGKYNLYVY